MDSTLSATSISSAKSPICAMFLCKFDVRTGYKIEWSKTINNKISLKGLEFKSLPSGLHSISRDVIAFIQQSASAGGVQDERDNGNEGRRIEGDNNNVFYDDDDDLFKKISYGVSVFHQNAADGHDSIKSRADVKMYSLGILIDPDLNSEFNAKSKSVSKKLFDKISPTWRPIVFTSGWEYIDDLDNILLDWMNQTSSNKSSNDDKSDGKADNSTKNQGVLSKYMIFEKFFNNNKLLMPPSGANSAGSDSVITKSSTLNNHYSASSSADKRTNNTNNNTPFHVHHMLLALKSLIKSLGPLIFKVWKLALLRKKLVLHNSSTIERNCCYIYCISVLSTIPREILPSLISSGAKNFEKLQYYQPLYNIGINDIDYVQKLITRDPSLGFIASTTDEILLFKVNLYDYGIRFPNNIESDDEGTSLRNGSISPEGEKNNDFLPHVTSSLEYEPGAKRNTNHPIRATQRDYRRFKILTNAFKIYDIENLSRSHNNLTKDINDLEMTKKWWLQVSEPVSWKEYAWKGFSWWATAGENDRSNYGEESDRQGLITMMDHYNVNSSSDENAYEGLHSRISSSGEDGKGDLNVDMIDSLNIVGYFQTMTNKIFEVLIDLVNNHEEGSRHGDRSNSEEDEGDSEEEAEGPANADDDYVENEEEEEEQDLLGDISGATQNNNNGNSNSNGNVEKSQETLWIDPSDIYEMGLDPYSSSDSEFVIELVKVWWGKEAKVGSYLGNVCCF
ncbi:hypothetical protein PACTADRAFT_33369 [Pachysolen tannophilus NRRL Y-2460]|uniref:DUF4484 domain-containing protein n=1 Tax=Pachysolen tannophilus NRRL Y-2460 TaxID=669874 RepID=A0A1E4TWQ7_PACTA|nr:hypothetical protein PACTADRAFT_33369 [Pachysolen tannophilus NRRL Y-2460]